MEKNAQIDCRKCGLCCLCNYGQTEFCNFTIDDYRLLLPKFKKDVVETTIFDMVNNNLFDYPYLGKTRYIKLKNKKKLTACTFLRGIIGERNWCVIYENRPKVCREVVKPGDKNCMLIRSNNMELLK